MGESICTGLEGFRVAFHCRIVIESSCTVAKGKLCHFLVGCFRAHTNCPSSHSQPHFHCSSTWPGTGSSQVNPKCWELTKQVFCTTPAGEGINCCCQRGCPMEKQGSPNALCDAPWKFLIRKKNEFTTTRFTTSRNNWPANEISLDNP